MHEFDDKLINDLVEVIYTKIEDKFLKLLNKSNTEFCYNAYVESTGTNQATVIGQFGKLTLPNATGESLNVNDVVKVYSTKGDMSGAYIGTKIPKKG